MKTYVAIIRDHSASMKHLVKGAMNDYNLIIDGIKDSKSADDETFITVVECGVGALAEIRVIETNFPVEKVKHINTYSSSGSGTPLFDSVGRAISILEQIKNVDENSAFLVLVITDGEENRSKFFTEFSLSSKINELQKTDKWTFVFRGPKGTTRQFQRIGVASGNIMEWEQTNDGLAQSTSATTAGINNYFTARSTGKTSTDAFYANVKVSPQQVKNLLAENTNNFVLYSVPSHKNGCRIDEFFKNRIGNYSIGSGFYQLTKTEKAVQDYKEIALLDKYTGKIYSGKENVRTILGLPLYGSVKLIPGDHKNYDIFIQSTSVNRKLIGETKVLYKKA